MHDALLAIDHHMVAVQRLQCRPLRMDNQRNGQRPGDNRGMAADGACFKDDPLEAAAIVQQFCGTDIARHQNRVVGHLSTGVGTLPCQNAQQPVGQIIQIAQPFAQIVVRRLTHTGPRQRLFLFHRRFGAQTAADVFLHPAHPALGIGEHLVGLKHFGLFFVRSGQRQHLIDAHAQFLNRFGEAFQLAVGIVGDRVADHHAGLMEPDLTLGHTFLRDGPAQHGRLAVAGLHRAAFPNKSAQFSHFGQNHGDHFKGIDLVRRKLAGLFGLHHQHTQGFPQTQDRHAHETGKNLFARFRHKAKAAFLRRVGGVDDPAAAGHLAHQPLAQTHPRLVDGLRVQPLGGAQFQRFFVPKQVDRADFAADAGGNQMGDLVQPGLTGVVARHCITQTA
mmetsp:Transcript_23169/g.39621  ORF Transcript_23169/g.39621 Transcript_23169/m.39621 type:complete len:390 (-) Transcript_23169:3225-4394(-)